MTAAAALGLSPLGIAAAEGIKAIGSFALPNMTTPMGRSLQYAANIGWQNLLPDVADIFGAFLKGELTIGQLRDALQSHGIPLSDQNTGAATGRAYLWNAVLNSMGADIPLDTAYVAWVRGLLPDREWQRLKRRSGIANEFQLPLLDSPATPLPTDMLLALYNRGQFGDAELDRQLRASGFGVLSDRAAIKELSYQIPPVSDIITFAVKEAWDDDTVQRFGYDDEFPPELAFWCGKQGLNWGQPVTQNGQIIRPSIDWPHAYWRSHWTTISPSQAYEMLHRLRGNVADPATWRVPGVRPFTLDDVRTVLKIDDYPPAFRERLAAISYNVLGFRQIQQLYQHKIVNRGELIELYKDAGYSDTDAPRMAALAHANTTKVNYGQIAEQSKARVIHSYEVGTLNRTQAESALYRILNEIPVKDMLDLLSPVGDITEAAHNDPLIQSALTTIDHKIATDTVVKRIAIARKRYITGQLTVAQVQGVLMQMGIADQRIIDYIALWSAEAAKYGREAPASQAIKLHRRGLINDDQLYVRLSNVGYLPGDVLEMIALANIDIASDKAKLAKAAVAEHAKQVAAGEKAAAKAKAAAKESLTAERYSLSKTDIVSAYKDKVMQRDEATGRLMMTGTAYADAKTLLDDADAKGKGKSSGSQTQGGGGGTPPGG